MWDEAWAASEFLSQDLAKDLVRNACHCQQDRLQPVMSHSPPDTGGHTNWYITHDPTPAEWDSECLLMPGFYHRVSSRCTAIRVHWHALNNGNVNAAGRFRVIYPTGGSASIIFPSADGVTLDWGGAAFSDGEVNLSLNKWKGNDPNLSGYVTVLLHLRCDCELYQLSAWEV